MVDKMVKPYVARDIIMKVFHQDVVPIQDPDSDIDDDIQTVLKPVKPFQKNVESFKDLGAWQNDS